MTAAATQQTPAIPPRPSRSADKEASTSSIPKIPPRPVNKRIDRSKSPNAERFAQSPLTGGIPYKSPTAGRFGPQHVSADPIERSSSVPMPSVGEEGMEYSAVTVELHHHEQTASPPAQTRTVANDLKLHEPTPSLAAQDAKQRVMAVTRTDSEKAASFGIGQPGSGDERAISRDGVKKKPSTSFSLSSDHSRHDEDENNHHGQRVPMNPHLGDVQAPSPAPSEASKRHHGRKHSARGLPPGSYGLHGHGVTTQDKLEKEYYLKHPDTFKREENSPYQHDRPSDFSMSSSDLNKLVRDSGNRDAARLSTEHRATPTEEVAFQASEEYACRMSSSRPTSTVFDKDGQFISASKESPPAAESSTDDEKPIHVDDARHPEYHNYGDEDEGPVDESEEYHAPILASDEVGKDPKTTLKLPAIRPHLDRRGSSYDSETQSRPVSRPGSIHNTHTLHDFGSPRPLEDVEEYEPLFSEEASKAKKQPDSADENKQRRHFPSKDIWEDAPNSVYYTTEVSTPEVPEELRRKSSSHQDQRPLTPAQAFALHQEELAERESRESRKRENNFLSLSEDKPTWVGHQTHLRAQKPTSGGSPRRFPSRDVWEDAPESQLYEATLSGSLAEEKTPTEERTPTEEKTAFLEDKIAPTEEKKPEIPVRPVKKSPAIPERPVVPSRPKPRQNSSDDAVKQRPPVSEKPKPFIPPRPTKNSPSDSKDASVSKPKPPVPSRPAGSKISALQAGFMSDLNKRLQLGPQAPKKDEPAQEDKVEEIPKEAAPLSDARKSRARGPQRRAPAKSPAPAAVQTAAELNKIIPELTFSLPQTTWAIDPDEGDIAVDAETDAIPSVAEPKSQTLEKEVPAKEFIEPVKQKTKDELVGEPEKEEATSELETVDALPQVEKEEKLIETQEEKHLDEELKVHEQVQAELPQDDAEDEEPKTEKKTLAANTAGEGILEATIENKDEKEVEPVEVHEDVKA